MTVPSKNTSDPYKTKKAKTCVYAVHECKKSVTFQPQVAERTIILNDV